MDILLKRVSWFSEGQSITQDIRISSDIFSEIGDNIAAKKSDQIFDLSGHYIYPGLINSHDHLEMNLYGKMGFPPYNNYIEWAKDIRRPESQQISKIEKTNIRDRLLWGGLKNLISGCTTVVHHNPWNSFFEKKEFPVKVLKNFTWAHSLYFEKNIVKKFPAKSNTPFIVHAGEGMDETSAKEIKQLNELNLLHENTVLIHAVALNEESIVLLVRSNSAVVWCPESNLFMFKTTAPIDQLKSLRVSLGTDSTMTGSLTLLDEMHTASKTGLADKEQIFNMVTKIAAGIFKLPFQGITRAAKADFFITPIFHQNYVENLFKISSENVQLVVCDGQIKLIDESLGTGSTISLKPVRINGVKKYSMIDVAALKQRIDRTVGKEILELNPLWNLIEA
jgi:cytosine/adenosine deaminase-related metal-dependent hydrolase